MIVVLDLDDFSVVNNRLELLLNLKKQIPQFKVSLFTVPIDKEEDWGPYQNRKEFLKLIKENLDWIQLIPHGFRHDRREMRSMTYDEMKETLIKIEEAFKKDGLPFEKGFKAPHWDWNEDVVRALDDAGWWGAVDPRQPNMLKTKKYYQHKYSLDEICRGNLLVVKDELMKLHGHIYGSRNDIGKYYRSFLSYNMMNAEYKFVTDYLEKL